MHSPSNMYERAFLYSSESLPFQPDFRRLVCRICTPSLIPDDSFYMRHNEIVNQKQEEKNFTIPSETKLNCRMYTSSSGTWTHAFIEWQNKRFRACTFVSRSHWIATAHQNSSWRCEMSGTGSHSSEFVVLACGRWTSAFNSIRLSSLGVKLDVERRTSSTENNIESNRWISR